MPTPSEYISSILQQMAEVQEFLNKNPNVNDTFKAYLKIVDEDVAALIDAIEEGEF